MPIVFFSSTGEARQLLGAEGPWHDPVSRGAAP